VRDYLAMLDANAPADAVSVYVPSTFAVLLWRIGVTVTPRGLSVWPWNEGYEVYWCGYVSPVNTQRPIYYP